VNKMSTDGKIAASGFAAIFLIFAGYKAYLWLVTLQYWGVMAWIFMNVFIPIVCVTVPIVVLCKLVIFPFGHGLLDIYERLHQRRLLQDDQEHRHALERGDYTKPQIVDATPSEQEDHPPLDQVFN
jgi:hypothetical protein